MDSNLELIKPKSGKVTQVKLLTSQPITEGAEIKNKLDLKIGTKRISLIKRVIESGETIPEYIGFMGPVPVDTLAKRYAQALQLLQKRGLPVPQTVRVLSQNEVAVTNVVAGGGRVFDVKSESLKFHYPHLYGQRQVTEYDHLFINIKPEELKKAAEQIASHASREAVELAFDSPYHIVFKPDGSWRLMTLDIAFMKIGKDIGAMNKYLKNKGGWKLDALNQRIAENWLDPVLFLQRKLKQSLEPISKPMDSGHTEALAEGTSTKGSLR